MVGSLACRLLNAIAETKLGEGIFIMDSSYHSIHFPSTSISSHSSILSKRNQYGKRCCCSKGMMNISGTFRNDHGKNLFAPFFVVFWRLCKLRACFHPSLALPNRSWCDVKIPQVCIKHFQISSTPFEILDEINMLVPVDVAALGIGAFFGMFFLHYDAS